MHSLRNPWQAAGRAATHRPTDGTRKGYLDHIPRVARVYPVETVRKDTMVKYDTAQE